MDVKHWDIVLEVDRELLGAWEQDLVPRNSVVGI